MTLIEFFNNPKSCEYFNNEVSSFRYFYIEDCNSHFANGLLVRGWRRFGEYFFVPTCKSCSKCLTIRVLVNDYKLSKTHKRIIKKNLNTKIYISRPSIDSIKLDLFNRYHLFMSQKKGWKYEPYTMDMYIDNFINGFMDYGYEFTYKTQDDELIGVGLVDIFKDSISAIYFYYDPKFLSLSPGTFNIINQLLFAKNKNIAHFYPGYYIANHYSMGYKKNFKPFEVLTNEPDIFDAPIYEPFNESLESNLKAQQRII